MPGTILKLRWMFSFYLLAMMVLPPAAYADRAISEVMGNAPNLAFDDLMLYPEFATFVTIAARQWTVDTSEFEESGLSVNRYGQRFGEISAPAVKSVRAHLVAKGVVIYNGLGPYPARLRSKLLQAEDIARSTRAGVWAQKHVRQGVEIEDKIVEEGFELVQGIVKSVAKRKSGTYLNFGDNWKTDFTVQISPRNRASFRKAGWTLEDLEAKTIRVRGWLRNYGGPFMQIYFPEQIEILEK
jgi:hypothetical protein